MDLSIIILNYKQANLIKYQLKKLYTYNFDFDSEIIVVDNNSNDNIEEIIEENYPMVRLIKSAENLGFAGGNNLGIKNAKGEYVLIMNPDIRTEKNVIEKLLQFIKNNPEAGIVVPRLNNADKTIQETCFCFPDWHYPLYRRTGLAKTKKGQKWLNKFLMEDFDHLTIKKVDWIMGACFIISKEKISRIGYLDDNFFMYLEDMDLCRRLWKEKKATYYLGNISAVHLHQKASVGKNIISSLLLNKLSRIHLKSWIYYRKKYKGQDIPKSCPSYEK